MPNSLLGNTSDTSTTMWSCDPTFVESPGEPIEKTNDLALPTLPDGDFEEFKELMERVQRQMLDVSLEDDESSEMPDMEEDDRSSEVEPEDVDQATITNYEAWRIMHYRRYHAKWCDADYMMPNDARANTFLDKIDGHLPQGILDVGTGTGLWAWRAAKKFPHCEVIGTDISPTQNTDKLGNLTYLMLDFTSPKGWPFPDKHFDFVHMQCLAGSVKDWDALLHEVWRVLKPCGWFEIIECPLQIHSLSSQFNTDCPALASLGYLLQEAGDVIGQPMIVDSNDLDVSLNRAGFLIETSRCVQCPLSPQDPQVHKSIAARFLRDALMTDIEGYLARLLYEGHLWDDYAFKHYTKTLRLELNDEGSMDRFKPFINVQFKAGFKMS